MIESCDKLSSTGKRSYRNGWSKLLTGVWSSPAPTASTQSRVGCLHLTHTLTGWLGYSPTGRFPKASTSVITVTTHRAAIPTTSTSERKSRTGVTHQSVIRISTRPTVPFAESSIHRSDQRGSTLVAYRAGIWATVGATRNPSRLFERRNRE